MDLLLKGGIPEGSLILLAGKPGTGKTILSMQWLFAGSEFLHEPGLYIAVTEPLTKTMSHFKTMNFFMRNPPEARKVHFTDFRVVAKSMDGTHSDIDKRDIDKMIRTILDLVRHSGCKRLVIDSITAISYVIRDETLIRYLLFNLSLGLKDLGCTAMLTSEVRGDDYSIFGVEEFMVDGIIIVKYTEGQDHLKRFIRVLKMRGMDHDKKPREFDITDEGVMIKGFETPHKATKPKRVRARKERDDRALENTLSYELKLDSPHVVEKRKGAEPDE